MRTRYFKNDPNERSGFHTISLFVANKPGVLVRVALVFSRRGFNVESLVVSPALDGRFSRMTITATGDGKTLDQIIKQIAKLVDVVHACEHEDADAIEKEFALIKVGVTPQNRSAALKDIEQFTTKVLDLTAESLIFQAVGSSKKLDNLVSVMDGYGIIEMVRTGKILMTRGTGKT
jgi:acetolactate synthase small subunit